MTRHRHRSARSIPAPRPTWQAASLLALALSALWLLCLAVGRGIMALL